MQALLWFTVFCVAYAASLIVRGFVLLHAARAMGLHVRTLWFGYGSAIKSWTSGKITIALGSWPIGAQVGIPSDQVQAEGRKMLLAGSIAWSVNAALVIALWPSEIWTQTASGKGPLFLQGPLVGAVFLANLVLCLHALGSPASYDAGQEIPTDEETASGRQEADILAVHLRIAMRLFDKGRTASAARWLQRTLRDPEVRSNLEFTAQVALLIFQYGNPAVGVDLFREVRAKVKRPFPEYWFGVCDGFASQVVYRHITPLLPEALAVINEAIEGCPGSLTLLGTRGSIHFDLGDDESASRDLIRCNQMSSSPLDRGISSAFLAAISFRSGDVKAAHRYGKAAKKWAGDHIVVKRVLASIEPHDTSAPTPA
jgi:hypothetical protein